ncbi:4583_t:CDS:2 [Funneliformis caledonium]|uniref:4583_t:CDS:1 n=1 Tax=Funneliformis caledonium TaxID=1117310 RepID=A0A9N9HL31_9GLOM|nr:4583_t:CDS:2 [Funneliformis caledonium]
MTYNLPLNETFKYLNEDLLACLLVMRLWCEIAVRILWRIIKKFETLLAYLPNESEATLIQNVSSFKYILFEDNENNIQLETKRMEGTVTFITNSGEFIDDQKSYSTPSM